MPHNLAKALTEAWASDSGLSSPKLTPVPSRTGHWYRYYAGYADAFVADVVAQLPESTGPVLDPWNGAGTTTSVAAVHGIDARGFDVNPAAVVISKARILSSDVAPSIVPLTSELLAAVESHAAVADDDLLLRWMTPRAVAGVRRLAATINRALIESEAASDPTHLASEMSSLAAVFYLALFRVVRDALSPFGGTNPTWLRQKAADDEKVDVDLRTLRPALIAATKALAPTVASRGLAAHGTGSAKIAVCDSAALPLANDSVDAVITSPPYCTRIDYAVATLPELATLGLSTADFRALRDRLIGTPTRDGSYAHSDARWGTTATDFLRLVSEHSSHASSNYYVSFFSQYFAGMWRSLTEVARVSRPGRPVVLVVQDSHYKEIRADVPGVMCDMAARLGWQPIARRDVEVRTRALIHPATRKYRQTATATEAVLAFST